MERDNLEIKFVGQLEQLNATEKLHVMRHSASHVLAMAVLRLYPDAQLATGPAISNGFYYDFHFNTPLSSNDLPKIEQEMENIKKEALPFERVEVSIETAEKIMAELKQPYKLGLLKVIKETGDTAVVDEGDSKVKEGKIPTTVTFYKTGNEFVDLCRGPHVSDTSKVGDFSIDSLAAAHWRNSKGTPELTRIYGFGFANNQDLKEFSKKRDLAKERDHRKLGPELELFTFSEKVGPGLTLWLPKGATVRRVMEDYIVKEQTKRGYKHVYSPHIGNKGLWEQSGHWDLYREKMYSPMSVEDQEYLVKPMTCPIHCQMYDSKPRSYRDLPVRLAEVASVYRYEQSGELHGLMRVRAFTQDDAHIFARPEQVVDEFLNVFQFTQDLLKTFGFSNYKIRVGVRSDTEKYLGNDAVWQEAEEKIMQAVSKTGVEYTIKPGEAAFYGPKADFLLTDALGREWQCGTVQVDFMLPERFALTYTDSDGAKKRPVMIHRAPLGSMERFFAILLENNGGAFPTWLAPVQTVIIPISDQFIPYAREVATSLSSNEVRVEVDEINDTLNKKIRQAEKQKIPYIVVVGNKEVESETVSVRRRGNGKPESMSQDSFTSQILEDIKSKE